MGSKQFRKLRGMFVQNVILSFVFLLAFCSPGFSGGDLVVTLYEDGLNVVNNIGDGYLSLQVALPDGTITKTGSSNSDFNWYLPENADDGFYRYEVFFSVPTRDEDQDDQDNNGGYQNRTHGSFRIENGVIKIPGDFLEGDQESNNKKTSWFIRAAGAILDWLVPPAAAADLNVSSGIPSIYFNDTDITAQTNEWRLRAIQEGSGTISTFELYDDINDVNVVEIEDSGNDENSLVIDGNGDISLADSKLFIDRSAGRLGIGTTTPSEELVVVGDQVWSWDTHEWRANPGGNGLWFFGDGGASVKFVNTATQDTLVVGGRNTDAYSYVGLGASDPQSKLHVRGPNNAKVLVENYTSTTAKRDLFELRNDGEIRFTMNNTDTGDVWDFLAADNGFNISLVGTGGTEFLVSPTGGLQIGPGGAPHFVVTAAGNVYVQGNLNATGSKSFVADYPGDPNKQIFYAAQEGPEVGTYYRGTAAVDESGTAIVELPDHFAMVTEDEGLTVQITPVGEWHSYFIAEKTTDHIVVKVAPEEIGNLGDEAAFDFRVEGIRKGYADFAVIRENTDGDK